MASARVRNDMIVVPRYGIRMGNDMAAIEIQQRLHWLVFVVNLYNPPAGGIGAHLIGQRVKPPNLPDTNPTAIVGDLNLHRPDWEKMTTEPIAAARAMAEWLRDRSFPLLNVRKHPTSRHHNHM